MEEYKNLTAQDYINAKTDEKAFEKVYLAHQKLIAICMRKIQKLESVPEFEYQDALRDGLLKAILKFDPEKGVTFANFAITCMINSAKILNRRKASSSDICEKTWVLSLEGLFQNDDFDEGSRSWEEILDNGEIEESQLELLEEKIDLTKFLQLLQGNDRDVLALLLAGKNGKFIADEKGVTRQRSSQMIITVKKKIKNVVERAKIVHLMLENGKDYNYIARKLGFSKPDIAIYYHQIYNFIFLDGKKPKVNKIWLSNPQKIYVSQNTEKKIGRIQITDANKRE